MEKRKSIKKLLRKYLNEQQNAQDFEDRLLDIMTLDLEDDQVRIPSFNEDSDTFIFQINNIFIHIRNYDDMPKSGPFELFILDMNDDVIGFIRGTKHNKMISFNLVYIIPEERGKGIGYDIYEYFLNNGYTIKSDKEITSGTYSIYWKLLKNGFTPILFDDGRVGLQK